MATISIVTTPAMDALITRLNQASNPVNPPTDLVFATSLLTDALRQRMLALKAADAAAALALLQAAQANLTPAQIANLTTIANNAAAAGPGV